MKINFYGGSTTFKNYLNNKNTRIINNNKLDIYNLIGNIDKKNVNFYDDENFLNNIIYPLYKNHYINNSRKDINNIDLKKFTGRYVGDVVDEYDDNIDKNKNGNFNCKNNYDDLDELLNNYKKDLIKIFK